MITHRMLHVTAALAAAGGAAWVAKLAIIAATGGATAGTPESVAAVLYFAGIALLAAGASAVTLRAARGRGRAATALAVLAAPLLAFISYAVLESVAQAAVGETEPAWLGEEVGILLTGTVWLAVGIAALRRR